MNKILKSLRKKFPDVNFVLTGLNSRETYYQIQVDKFILLDKEFLVRNSRLTKQYDINFLVVYGV